MTAIGPKTLELPTQVVLNLLEFAGRAPLLRPEWMFLEEWEEKIKQAIAMVQQQQEAAAQAAAQKVAATPTTTAKKTPAKQEPFDPNTPRAERRRAQRAAAREAAKQAKVEALVGKGGDALVGDVGGDVPTA